jgi:CHASE2 domain-containing sensor protein
MKPKNEPGKKPGGFALFPGLWVGAGAALLVFLLFLIPFINRFEMLTLDYLSQHRTTPPVNPAIVLIGIDDKSIEKIERWPWPRS